MILDTWWKVAILVGCLGAFRLILPYLHRLSSNVRSGITEFLDSALIALGLVFLIIKPFIIQAFFIPSVSMVPALLPGDRILVNKFIYRFREPHRQEIVVFRAPPRALAFSGKQGANKKDFIKRVIALPGDKVRVHQGKVYLNGKVLEEPYLNDKPAYEFPPGGGTYQVPEGHLFVLGDHRNNSNDSHRWGGLPRKNVLGKAMCIFWPPGRVSLVH